MQVANMRKFISIISMFQEIKHSEEHEGGIQRERELQDPYEPKQYGALSNLI